MLSLKNKQKTSETVKTERVKTEPFIRITKRDNPNSVYKLFVRLVAIGFSVLCILIFLSSVSKSTFGEVWGYIGHGAFDAHTNFFKQMFLLLGIGIGLAPAYKMKFWNIGGQGQVLMGGLLTTTMMIYLGNSANSLIIFCSLLLSVLAGGIWAMIPAFFKVKINANETLFTLMMNYVAIQLVAFSTHMWNPNAAFSTVNATTKAGYLAPIGNNEYGAIVLVVAICMFLMYGYMHYTKHGYEISVVGESLNTARYAGINTKKVILRTVFISGAICGLMGFLYVAGADHTIATTTSGGYGFTAIIVAWAAKFNPFTMAIISFAITLFDLGAGGVSDACAGLNQYVSQISVGIFLFFIIGCEFFVNYKINFNSKINEKKDKLCEKLSIKMPKTTKFIKTTSEKINHVDEKINVLVDKFHKVVSKIFEIIADKIKELFKKFKKKDKDEVSTENEEVK